MIELIDTHAHIYLSKFQDDLDEVLGAAKTMGVRQIYMPNIDGTSIESMLKIEQNNKDFCHAMMGIHPCYIKANFQEQVQIAHSWLEKRDFCAIGEIGIDLYWDKSHIHEQVTAFETQINWAKDLSKPIVIHCRDSMDLSIDIVRKQQNGNLSGVFHCFTGTIEQAKQVIDMGFMLGIGGVVTFKNGGLDQVLPGLETDWILLETDSPYLAPAPFRGKRNEPAYLNTIAARVGELMQCDLNEIASITTLNALRLFENG
jgi:TatD DNase family protein